MKINGFLKKAENNVQLVIDLTDKVGISIKSCDIEASHRQPYRE